MRKMLRKPIAAFGTLLIVITLVLVGCRKNLSNELQKDDPSDDLEMFAKRIGVDPSSIKDSGNFILVGGDMLILKKDLLTTTTKRQVVATTSNSTPAWSGGPISPGNRGDIKIYINDGGPVSWSLPPSVVDRYREAVRQAISNFNTLIPFTSIKMREVSDLSVCDISVNFNLGGAKAGYARYPVNGKPGTEVDLNLAMESYFPTIASATRLTTHELGHAIGLFHTDEIPASSFTESYSWGFFYLKQIPGTPGFATTANPNPDIASFILKDTYAGLEWTQSVSDPTGVGFSDDDIKAIQYLYPVYEISASNWSCEGGYCAINNLPAGATVSWNGSPSGLVSFIPSGTAGNSMVYALRNGDGVVDVSATININGISFNTGALQFKLGTAGISNSVIMSPNHAKITPSSQYDFSTIQKPGCTYQWIITPIGSSGSGGYSIVGGTNSPNLSVYFNTVGKKYALKLNVTNECGTAQVWSTTINVVADDGTQPNQ